MRPELWQPPIELSPTEQSIVKRIKRAAVYLLGECRHELFDQSFQQELSKLYADSAWTSSGSTRTTGIGNNITSLHWGIEAIEALTMDRRWQLVVNCLDCEQPPFVKQR